MNDTVELDGHDVELSHLDRIYFPAAGITKGDVVDYYRRIADLMLPHLRDRPLVMHRWPEGIDGEDFWMKQVPDHFPDWIDRVRIERRTGGTLNQVVCQDTASLVYLANQGVLVPHVWPSRVDALERPDQLIFDLDPSMPDLEPVRRAAGVLHDLVDDAGLTSFVKSSGSRGLHVHVPIERRWSFDEAKACARAVAERVVASDPESFTLEQRKRNRGDRVFLDVLRNEYAQHAVAPYAVRARPTAPIAVPLDWDEATASDFDPQRYTIENVFRRVGQKDDPWADFGSTAGSLDALRTAVTDG